MSELPGADAETVDFAASALAAVEGARALVVMTPWPEFLEVGADELVGAMSEPVVVDPVAALATTLGSDRRIRYVRVGAWR